MKPLLSLLFSLLFMAAAAQSPQRPGPDASPQPPEHPWEQLLAETMAAEDMESEAWQDTYDLLCQLEQQPLDLNVATRDELEQLPFLSDQQVQDFIEYRDRYQRLKSVNELRMVRSMDYQQIALLRYFAYVGEQQPEQGFPRLSHALRYGRHELMASLRVPFYSRRGDQDGYLGYRYRHWLRYQFSYKDYLKVGMTGAQDAGEPFFAGRNGAGYDFYSYYLQLRRLRRLETLVVGKYKLSAGMGLVLNNSFGLGKLVMLQQLGRSVSTVRPHSSRSPSGYMQGAAATLRLGHDWQLTAFASYRAQDATLNDDGTARTIVSDGYHRTPLEMGKKHNTHSTDGGGHVAFRHGGFHAGATLLYTHFDRRLSPDTKTLYRRYFAQGQDFLNVSADYGYINHRWALNGEMALDRDGHLATINSLSLNAADGLSLLLLQRFYSYRYTSLYARAFAEGGHVQNESGVYLGATWKASPWLQLQLYTDYAYFPWARYQVSQSSYAWDNMLTAAYSRTRWTLTGRYRLHLRQKDDAARQGLATLTEHRSRLAFSWTAGPLQATTQADGVVTGDGGRGYMLTQTAVGQWSAWRLSAGGGYFHTDGYSSRLYVYERGPLYSFGFPAYYGEGMRLMLMARLQATARLTLTAKVGMTRYFDRSTIGTGLQAVNSPRTVDLDLQLRWKL